MAQTLHTIPPYAFFFLIRKGLHTCLLPAADLQKKQYRITKDALRPGISGCNAWQL